MCSYEIYICIYMYKYIHTDISFITSILIKYVCIYIYISKVHQHRFSKIRNPSTILWRANVRVAAEVFIPLKNNLKYGLRSCLEVSELHHIESHICVTNNEYMFLPHYCIEYYRVYMSAITPVPVMSGYPAVIPTGNPGAVAQRKGMKLPRVRPTSTPGRSK